MDLRFEVDGAIGRDAIDGEAAEGAARAPVGRVDRPSGIAAIVKAGDPQPPPKLILSQVARIGGSSPNHSHRRFGGNLVKAPRTIPTPDS